MKSRVDDELERADAVRTTEQGNMRRYRNLRAIQEPFSV
jgi:hypothetical protein